MSLAERLFPVDPHVRYVAENCAGAIVEMAQSPERPTLNPGETDRMEEGIDLDADIGVVVDRVVEGLGRP